MAKIRALLTLDNIAVVSSGPPPTSRQRASRDSKPKYEYPTYDYLKNGRSDKGFDHGCRELDRRNPWVPEREHKQESPK
jgi:hypothetical protein